MNILELQEALKDMSESQLVNEAKQPSGQVPSYMVLSELNRRKDMRERYQLNQTKPTATVAEELITQTEQGLGSMMPRRPQMPMQQSAIAQNMQQPMRMQGGGKLSIGGMSIEDIMKKIRAGEMKVPRGDSLYEEMDGPDRVSTMIGYNPAGEGDDASVYEVIRSILLKPHPLEEDTNKVSSINEVISMNDGRTPRAGSDDGFDDYLRRMEEDRKDEIVRGMRELNSARRNREMMLDDEGSVQRMPAPYDEDEAMRRRNQDQADYAQRLSRAMMGMRNPIGYGVGTGVGALIDMYRNKADETEMFASGGVIKMQAGGDPSQLTDDQLRKAIAAIKAAGSITQIQQDNLLRLQDELDVRQQQKQDIMASNAQANRDRMAFAERGLDYLSKNIANPLAAAYDTVVGLPAAVAQNVTEYVGSLISGEEPQYVGSAPAQTALFGTEPSIDISGRPNAVGIEPRKVELARQEGKADKAAAMAKGIEEGRLGATDPTPSQTLAEAEETIENILSVDPSLGADGDYVLPYMGAPNMVRGQQAPVLRTDVPAYMDDDADVGTIDRALQSVEPVAEPVDEAQLYAEAMSGETPPPRQTQTSAGTSGLPLPLLLEAARFGADIADRGTRGENFLGSIAGAGKTSIDRGLKFAEKMFDKQQGIQRASAKRAQGLEDFLLKEQIKKIVAGEKDPTINELKSSIELFDQMASIETDEQKKYGLQQRIADLQRQLDEKLRLSGSGNTQSVLQSAQAARQARSS